MKKLYLINNWGQTTGSHVEDMKYATPDHLGKWKNLEYTLNFNEADYYIIFEGVPLDLREHIDYSRSIYVQLEPPWLTHKDNFITKQNLMYKVEYESMFGVAMWWSYVPFNTFAEPYPFFKEKVFSCVMSNKIMKEGHRLRLEFLKKYVKKYNNIDIFGWGLKSENLGKCFVRTLHREDTAFGYKNYDYSFVCENGSYPNYATARLFDCILNRTIPIYWGCSNLDKYFPKDSYYAFDVQKNSIEELFEISQKPITKNNIIALQEAKKITLYEYNIWEVLHKIIEGKI